VFACAPICLAVLESPKCDVIVVLIYHIGLPGDEASVESVARCDFSHLTNQIIDFFFLQFYL
jgi:hypothetical protein